MRIALVGAGQIGRLHGALVAAAAGRRRGPGRRRRPGPDGRDGGSDRWPGRAVGRVGARPRRRGHHRRLDRGARAPRHGRHRTRPADVLREAACVRPGRDRRARRPGRGSWRRRPGRLPAPVRSRLPGGAPAHRVGRARDRVPGPLDRPRSSTTARGVHPPLGRALPRFVDPRLRRAPLGDRAGGRRGLRHRVGARLSRLRALRRRRHRGGHPDPGRRDPRRPQPDTARPARLRRPDGDRRLPRRGGGRARAAGRRSGRSSPTRPPWPVRPGSRSSAASSPRIGTS